jgi:hypothetical protein
MRIWQTGTYPVSAFKFYAAAYPQRACLGVNWGDGLTADIVNLSVGGAPIVTFGRFDVTGIYVTRSDEPTLEILAPRGGTL